MTNSMIRILAAFALLAAPLVAAAQAGQELDAQDRHAAQAQFEAARAQMQEAQRMVEEAAKHYADVSLEASEARAYAYRFLTEPRRAMIGVIISSTVKDGVNQGVEVTAVTPGGPAEIAGLRPGDVLTSVNGQPLDEPGNVESTARLREVIGELSEGDSVEFGYLRDGQAGSVAVIAERRTPTAMAPVAPVLLNGNTRIELADGMANLQLNDEFMNEVVELKHALHFAFHGHFWEQIELVNLNPQLGRYFGTNEGLLVINVPEDFAFDLQGGDVITNINGRQPKSSSHAFRMLRSFEAGEVIALDLHRDQGPMTVEIVVPERKDMQGWSWVPEDNELRSFSFPLKDSFVNGYHFQFSDDAEADADASIEIQVITDTDDEGRL